MAPWLPFTNIKKRNNFKKTKVLFFLIFRQIFGMVIQILMQYVEWNITLTANSKVSISLLLQTKFHRLIRKTPLSQEMFYHIIFCFHTLVEWMISGPHIMCYLRALKLFITKHLFFKKKYS